MITVTVAPDGNDGAEGDAAEPLQTLAAARDRLRAVRTDGPATVELRGGTYPLQSPLILDARDANTRWRSAPGERAVLVGGRSWTPSWLPGPGPVRVAEIGPGIEVDQLFVDGVRQTLARYPNRRPGERLDGYADDAIDPVRVAGWADPTTALVRGLHPDEWGGTSYRIVGTSNDGTPRLEWAGDNQRGSALHAEYRMVENVAEELDEPGEWFYDRETGRLSYWPKADQQLETAVVTLGEIDELIMIAGSRDAVVDNITFERLTFGATHRTLFSGRYEPLTLSDWTIVRRAAVRIRYAHRVRIIDSHFDQVGGNAVMIDGHGRDIRIAGNHFTGSGASDVVIIGRQSAVRDASTWTTMITEPADRGAGPADDDYPAEITVAGNIMSGTGHFEKQSAAVQIAIAANVGVIGNTISDGPRAGINIGDGTFGGHRIADNDLYRLVGETGDHGPINAWGRTRYWPGYLDRITSDNVALAALDTLEPTVIEHNRIRHDGEWGIDLDDGSSWYVIRGNLLLGGGVKLREGYHRQVIGNIFVGGGCHSHVSPPDNGDEITRNLFLTDRPYHLIRADPRISGAHYHGNLFFNNGRPVLGVDESWRAIGCDLDSITADPLLSADRAWDDPDLGEVTFADDSPVHTLGFTPFDLSGFGAPGAADPRK